MTEETQALEPAIAENKPAETTTTPEVAKPAEAESAPAAVEPSDSKPDKIQERFDKLTRDKYDALRAADTERYQRERLEERLRALEAKPEPVAPVTPPTQEAFGYDDAKYAAALAEYNRTLARNEALAVIAQERARDSEAQRIRAWDAKQAEFAKSKPDYAEKVTLNRDLPITQYMADAIRDSDVGPQVAYFLAENVDRARAISALSPIGQAREIGRIEAALEAQKASAAKPVVSKAPPPPSQLDAVEPEVSKNPDDMSMDEWLKWRNKQIKRRR